MNSEVSKTLVEIFRDCLHRGKQPAFSAGDLRYYIDELNKIANHIEEPHGMVEPAACKTCNSTGIEYDGAGHTCTACNGIAAPAVERQEPVTYALADLLKDLPDGYSRDDVAFGWNECVDNYRPASPPAQVAVVLPERREPTPENPYLSDEDLEWNACLDKVKELNQ